jgi:hypothetical protein
MKLSRLNLYQAYRANEKSQVGGLEKLASAPATARTMARGPSPGLPGACENRC